MRTIDHIVIHCSATREDRSLTVAELEENHRCRGFRGAVGSGAAIVLTKYEML